MRMELVHPLRLRLDRAVGAHARRRRSSRSPARTRLLLRTPVEHEGRDLARRRRSPSPRATACRSCLRWFPSQRAAARADRRRRRRSRTRRVLGATGRRAARTRALARRRAPLADHAEGADLRADRRHRRGADDVAAGVDRRRAQLGLPLLLAARRDPHALALHRARLRRGGRRAGATGCCAPSPASPDDLQIMYGVAGERRLTELELPGCRLRGLAARCGSATARRDQLQLDVYGEVARRALPGARGRASSRPTTRWRLTRS